MPHPLRRDRVGVLWLTRRDKDEMRESPPWRGLGKTRIQTLPEFTTAESNPRQPFAPTGSLPASIYRTAAVVNC